MRIRSIHPLAAAITALVLSTGACEVPGTTAPVDAELQAYAASVHSHTAHDDLLKAVRKATAKYHSPAAALRAGYEPDDQCVAVPGLGGMGFHWPDFSLVDPIFDLLRPEALIYAPGPNGQPRLVAVEYIVIDVGQDQPHFGDHPFDVGGTPVPVDHWSLHVWLYADNPSGIFTPFNPNISCD